MVAPRRTVDELLAAGRGGSQGAPDGHGLELLDGVVLRRALPSGAVVEAVLRLATALERRATGLDVEVRAPVARAPHDLLRPEVSLRRPLPPHLRRPAAPPTALVLAVLVADDERETAWRARRCGAIGVPEVWTLDPAGATAVRYAAPRGGVYSVRELLLPGERVAPRLAPWLEVEPMAARAGLTVAAARPRTTGRRAR
jgi:hypothetical protein